MPSTFAPALPSHPDHHHSHVTPLGTTLGSRTFHFHDALEKHMHAVHTVTSTQVLADAARSCLLEHRYIVTPARAGSIDASAVAGSMLRYAKETGGERAERYVAGAVLFCAHAGGARGWDLVGLADMWIMCFLWPVKASHRMCEPLCFESEPPTPADTDTAALGPSQRADIMRRDGSRCVVTGLWDAARMPIDALQDELELVVAPIVHPGIGTYTRDKARYASVTWDIVRSYAGVDGGNARLHDHGNAILLEPNHYHTFAALRWCFVAQDEAHSYRVENVPHNHALGETHGRIVKFKSHATGACHSPPATYPRPSSYTSTTTTTTSFPTCTSSPSRTPTFSPHSTSSPPSASSPPTTPSAPPSTPLEQHSTRTQRPVTPPNPKLIALHAGAARVLQTSGVGTVLERVMGHFPELRYRGVKRGRGGGGCEDEDEEEAGGGKRSDEGEGEVRGKGKGKGKGKGSERKEKEGEEGEGEWEGGDGDGDGIVGQLMAMLAVLGMLGV